MSERPVSPPAEPQASPAPAQRHLMRRVVLIDGIGALFLLLLAAVWFAANALLLIFACILFAVLLYQLSFMLHQRFGLNRQLALVIVLALLVAVIGLGGWAMAPQITDQANQLAKEVPAALQRLQKIVNQHPMLQRLTSQLPAPNKILGSLRNLVPDAGLFFGGVLGALTNVVIIVCVGIYFASSPRSYTHGFIKLVPPDKRERAGQVLQNIGGTLARWLIGKGCSMLIVGIALAIALTLLGVPLGLILGFIAGLLDFIPYLGPIMGGVPAVLIAFSISSQLAGYTLLVLFVIQMLEGYVLVPMIEARAVALPPALTILMQLIFGTLFGFAGVALATPLTAALVVLVSMLYIEDILGDKVENETLGGGTKDTAGHAQPKVS